MPKNKGHINFYESCDLTKKVYLIYIGNNNSGVHNIGWLDSKCVLQDIVEFGKIWAMKF